MTKGSTYRWMKVWGSGQSVSCKDRKLGALLIICKGNLIIVIGLTRNFCCG